MTNKIKHTQLTRTGYSYQDLICIRLLLEWYHEPNKYQWVCIEGVESSAEIFKGLDDVVAFNKDDKYELYQVKFTIDSERDDLKLDFEWLLKKKPRGTSFLQKWAMDVEQYKSKDQLSIASLMTNRIPNDEVLQSLNGNRIDINKIPTKTLKIINEQLGGRDKSKIFFDCFEFTHSQPEIDDLEKQLHDSVVPDHTTAEGWLRFLKAVERWATRKEQANNRRNNHLITYKGKTQNIKQWSEELNIKYHKLYKKISKYNWSIKKVLINYTKREKKIF